MASCSSSRSSSPLPSEEERERQWERERVKETCVLVEETKKHPDTVLKGLNRLRLNRELCDVVLCCGGQEFPCHRAVLASFSSYFQAMFTCGMLESRQDRVNVHGVEAHILDLLLTYAYTSEVAIPKEHVQDMLAAAHMLDVKAVHEKCCYYMRRHIDNNNCLGINSFAEAHSLEDLERDSMDYIIHHFGDVYMQEEFPSLPVDKVTKIISDEDLNVPKEEVVFEAAMLWINKCPTRKQHFEKFLELIRLPLISPSYLHNAMESLEVVKESLCCQRLISEAMEQHLLPYSETVHPRRTRGTALFVAGGELPDGSVSKKLWRYDPSHDDSWTMMASMNVPRWDFGLVVLDGYLWAVGGQDCSGCFVERYEPRTNTWQFNQDMPRCSNHPAVVTLDGLIYVFGTGFPDTDTAQLQPYKQRRIGGNQVSASTSRLAAHGGQVTRVPRATYVSAYKYNPKTAEWTEVAPMQVPRSASAALNGKIYVIGGKRSSVTTNKVECYDPTSNQWTISASIRQPCCHCGVVAMAGKIYVLGGKDLYGRALLDVQEYCDQTDKWKSVCELPDYYPHKRRGPEPKGRSFFSCVSLWLSTDVKNVPYPKPHESDEDDSNSDEDDSDSDNYCDFD